MKIERPKVLVVEDDHALRDVLMFSLTRHDYDVLVASNGREGLELVDQADLVLLNLNLPEVSGEEFLRTIREAGNYVPVVVVTGAVTREEGLARLGKYQIVDLIEKPFRTEDVLNAIWESMRKSEHLRTVERAPEMIDAFIRRQQRRVC